MLATKNVSSHFLECWKTWKLVNLLIVRTWKLVICHQHKIINITMSPTPLYPYKQIMGHECHSLNEFVQNWSLISSISGKLISPSLGFWLLFQDLLTRSCNSLLVIEAKLTFVKYFCIIETIFLNACFYRWNRKSMIYYCVHLVSTKNEQLSSSRFTTVFDDRIFWVIK